MRVAPTMGTSNSRSECFRLGETPQWCTDCALLLFCDNQRVCKGVNRERDAILHADFPHQLGHMGFHCTLANAEGRPDFLVGPARDQQFQYFLLLVGKGGAAGRESNSRSGTYAFNEHGKDMPWCPYRTLAHDSNSLHKFGRRGSLIDVALGSGDDGLENRLLVSWTHHDDGQIRASSFQTSHQIEEVL